MTASDEGILRSRPRYSLTSNSATTSTGTASPSADGTATRIDGGRSATGAGAGSSIFARKHKTAEVSKKKNRTLADLVKSSVNLSDEAVGITDSEKGNVISHQSLSAQKQNKQEEEVKFTEGESMATLQISENGAFYLKEPTTQNKKSGPEVVDSNDAIAVGVLGEDGQQVRFCEYGDEKNGENIGDKSSSRDRLDERIVVECGDDFDITDDGRKDNDSDNSSGGSTQDGEILRELGLEDLMGDLTDEEDEKIEDSDQETDFKELRSFRVFWELLTRWATPSTIDLVLSYQGRATQSQPDVHSLPSLGGKSTQSSEREEGKINNTESARNAVDIGSSRIAGIMSMLKMNITRSMAELNKIHKLKTTHDDGIEVIITNRRQVEQRLADLVTTFDSSVRAANLNMKMWKGLTTILIAIAFPSKDSSSTGDLLLPSSIRPLQVTVEEYRYLTQSAIISLSHTA